MEKMRTVDVIHILDMNIHCSYCGEWIAPNENKYLLQDSTGLNYEIRHKECLPENLE